MAKLNNPWAIHSCECPVCQSQPDSPMAQEHRHINQLIATADEHTRRLIVGFLAYQHGHGGIALLSQITGLDRNTITRGQRELQQPDLSRPPAPGRVRGPGGGRPRAEKKVRRS
jgi:hypothetical protein